MVSVNNAALAVGHTQITTYRRRGEADGRSYRYFRGLCDGGCEIVPSESGDIDAKVNSLRSDQPHSIATLRVEYQLTNTSRVRWPGIGNESEISRST